MQTLTQIATSTEPIQVSVSATLNGVSYNPTADPVAWAFVTAGSPPPDPTSGQFVAGTWETDPGPVYWASILVGPLNGGTPLTAGSYIAYLRVTDNPAVPIKPALYLIVV